MTLKELYTETVNQFKHYFVNVTDKQQFVKKVIRIYDELLAFVVDTITTSEYHKQIGNNIGISNIYWLCHDKKSQYIRVVDDCTNENFAGLLNTCFCKVVKMVMRSVISAIIVLNSENTLLSISKINLLPYVLNSNKNMKKFEVRYRQIMRSDALLNDIRELPTLDILNNEKASIDLPDEKYLRKQKIRNMLVHHASTEAFLNEHTTYGAFGKTYDSLKEELQKVISDKYLIHSSNKECYNVEIISDGNAIGSYSEYQTVYQTQGKSMSDSSQNVTLDPSKSISESLQDLVKIISLINKQLQDYVDELLADMLLQKKISKKHLIDSSDKK